MVVFGSYVNSDKEMLSDVDISLSWGMGVANLTELNEWVEQHKDEMKRFYHSFDLDFVQILMYMKRKALIYFRQRRAWIQFTTLNDPEE